MASFSKWLLIFILMAGFFVLMFSGASQYLSFEGLKQHHQDWLIYTESHYFVSVMAYIFFYCMIVAFSFPGAVFVTLAGGLLFGPIATLYAITGATLGAMIVFFAVKTALGEWLAKKASGKLAKMEKGFRTNAFHYLLFLRLLPVFPFWLINISAGLLNVPLGVFALTTLIGIIPGAFVYVMVGNGLRTVISADTTPHLGIILEPSVMLPLLGLALLSIAPVLYKRVRGNK